MPSKTPRPQKKVRPDRYMPSLKHLQAIGRVVLSWSRLEWCVEDAIHDVVGGDVDTMRALTTHMSLDKRLDALLSIIHAHHPDTKLFKDLQKIYRDIRQGRAGSPSLESERNRIIHSHWEAMRPNNHAFSGLFRSRGRLRLIQTIMTPDEIIAIAEKIDTINERLGVWLNEWRAQDKPST